MKKRYALLVCGWAVNALYAMDTEPQKKCMGYDVWAGVKPTFSLSDKNKKIRSNNSYYAKGLADLIQKTAIALTQEQYNEEEPITPLSTPLSDIEEHILKAYRPRIISQAKPEIISKYTSSSEFVEWKESQYNKFLDIGLKFGAGLGFLAGGIVIGGITYWKMKK